MVRQATSQERRRGNEEDTVTMLARRGEEEDTVTMLVVMLLHRGGQRPATRAKQAKDNATHGRGQTTTASNKSGRWTMGQR